MKIIPLIASAPILPVSMPSTRSTLPKNPWSTSVVVGVVTPPSLFPMITLSSMLGRSSSESNCCCEAIWCGISSRLSKCCDGLDINCRRSELLGCLFSFFTNARATSSAIFDTSAIFVGESTPIRIIPKNERKINPKLTPKIKCHYFTSIKSIAHNRFDQFFCYVFWHQYQEFFQPH